MCACVCVFLRCVRCFDPNGATTITTLRCSLFISYSTNANLNLSGFKIISGEASEQRPEGVIQHGYGLDRHMCTAFLIADLICEKYKSQILALNQFPNRRHIRHNQTKAADILDFKRTCHIQTCPHAKKKKAPKAAKQIRPVAEIYPNKSFPRVLGMRGVSRGPDIKSRTTTTCRTWGHFISHRN